MILPQINITDVSHVIQLAIAPVFLLNAVAALIGVLTHRLGRVVDRIRECGRYVELDGDSLRKRP